MTKRPKPESRPPTSASATSFGPLGDLIRRHRREKNIKLLHVADACECSVQFISNIEHGRAPLPWEKVPLLASVLNIPVEEIQIANLAIRSDFKSFMSTMSSPRNKGAPTTASALADAATAVAFAAKDNLLQEIIEKYNLASSASRKKFVKTALSILEH